MILIWRASGPSAPCPPIKALFAREKVCAKRRSSSLVPRLRGTAALQVRNRQKNDTLRFCGLVSAFEVIQSTTTLDKLVVLFPHLTLFTGEKVPGQQVTRGLVLSVSACFCNGRNANRSGLYGDQILVAARSEFNMELIRCGRRPIDVSSSPETGKRLTLLPVVDKF